MIERGRESFFVDLVKRFLALELILLISIVILKNREGKESVFCVVGLVRCYDTHRPQSVPPVCHVHAFLCCPVTSHKKRKTLNSKDRLSHRDSTAQTGCVCAPSRSTQTQLVATKLCDTSAIQILCRSQSLNPLSRLNGGNLTLLILRFPSWFGC